ncbi:MAG: hypothetical protein OHK0029_07700 [Armatimonadaceae bacterium]
MNEPNLEWTTIVAERKIQEAIEAGEFDNLPLSGQPIDLEQNPFETFEQRVANRVLKNARALPEWMQLEKDLQREVEAFGPARERGLRGIRYGRNAASRLRAAERLRADVAERMDLVNTMLLKYNMNAPVSAQRPFRSFKKAQEMATLEQEIAAAMQEAETRETVPAPTPNRRKGFKGLFWRD